MRLKYKCKYCPRTFYKEHGLISHTLFIHEFLTPVCSTGIDEKIFKDNMELIKKFRESRNLLSHVKTKLKDKFLKSIYGSRQIKKRFGNDYMYNPQLNILFIENLENYHNKLFTRLQYVNHTKYDECYNNTANLLKSIESKGLILQ